LKKNPVFGEEVNRGVNDGIRSDMVLMGAGFLPWVRRVIGTSIKCSGGRGEERGKILDWRRGGE